MSSPWKKQPELVAETVLKRAEISKVSPLPTNFFFSLSCKRHGTDQVCQLGRTLKARLALAQFKATRGWEHLTLDSIEPKIEEELRSRRPMSSGDMLSDSSSSCASEFQYRNPRNLMSSPLKEPAVFSDQLGPRSGSGSTGHRKRTYHNSFEHPSSSAASRKRFRSSPMGDREPNAARNAWKNHQLTQSSPIKPRRHNHFTTSNGPSLSFYPGTSESPDDLSENFAAPSDDEENTLPAHSFNIRSSPPRTPPPMRSRVSAGRRNRDKNGKSGEEGADLLLYLATSPSPAKPMSRARMQPPSTPPQKTLALPSSMMITPGGGGLLSAYGNPQTPSQAFDFSDFVNITPSPAQNAWPKTPRTVQTPASVARRRLTFEHFTTGGSSPILREPKGSDTKHTGLGMQLGGDLMS
jgi:hypothetical protein